MHSLLLHLAIFDNVLPHLIRDFVLLLYLRVLQPSYLTLPNPKIFQLPLYSNSHHKVLQLPSQSSQTPNSGGENVAPVPIEDNIKELIPLVSNAMASISHALPDHISSAQQLI